jgi:hypothetical protein
MTDLSFLSWLDDLPENGDETEPIEPINAPLAVPDEYTWLDRIADELPPMSFEELKAWLKEQESTAAPYESWLD